ncbi:MAG: RNA methyltransferase [Blastocatellia bacterium]
MNHVTIVLARPRDPNNIGAAARAMKNFGLTRLAVVTPWKPVWDEAVSAVNALDVLTNARVCAAMSEAIDKCTLVVGTADPRRAGQAIYTPADLAAELRATDHRLALVFGSEKHGLTNAELSHCHRLMSIPTVPDCPSMNLGQAVAVCCYELSRARETITGADSLPADRAASGELENTLGLLLNVLDRAGFVAPGNERKMEQTLRQSLLRLGLTSREIRTMCGALRRIGEHLPDE